MRAIPNEESHGGSGRVRPSRATQRTNKKETIFMSNQNTSESKSRLNIPEARAAMDRFKMEAAAEVGVDLKDGYNGDLTSREAGSVGGQMVKKMVESYEQSL